MSKYSALLRKQKHWWTRYKDENARNEWRGLAKLPNISHVNTASSIVEVELSEHQVCNKVNSLSEKIAQTLLNCVLFR